MRCGQRATASATPVRHAWIKSVIALSTITAGGLVSSVLSPSLAVAQQPTWSPQPFVPAQQATAPVHASSVDSLPTNKLRSGNAAPEAAVPSLPANASGNANGNATANNPSAVRNNTQQADTPMVARWRKVDTLSKHKSETAAFDSKNEVATAHVTIKQPSVQAFVAANAPANANTSTNSHSTTSESFDRFGNGAKQQIVLRASHEAIDNGNVSSRISSSSPKSDTQVVSASYYQDAAPSNGNDQWYSRNNRVAPPPTTAGDATPSVSRIRPSARPVATSGFGGQEPANQPEAGSALPAFPQPLNLPQNAAPSPQLQLPDRAPNEAVQNNAVQNDAVLPSQSSPRSLLENDPPRTSPFPEPVVPQSNPLNSDLRSPSDSVEPPTMNRNEDFDLPPSPPSRTDRGALDCDKYRQAANISIQRVRVDSSPTFVEGYKNRDSLNSKSAFAQTSPSRPWHSQSGDLVVEGRLIDLAYGSAVIELADGTQKTILLRKLSDADQVYISESWGVPVTCSLGNQNFYRRDFVDSTVTWKATAACHKPLYFEEVQLERYGHEFGPFVQPAISTAHFFGNVAVLPYKMGIHPPNECQYSLGYYRPGSCAPWTLGPVPISLRGALMQAKVVTGAALALP